MADQEPITSFIAGTPKATDSYPAVDTTDTTQSPAGTTKRYTIAQEYNYILTKLGINNITAAKVATTAALTAAYSNGTAGVGATLTNSGTQAVISIDGITLSLNDRVLVKNQASGAQNGVYQVTNVGSVSTNWILTRVTDFDTSGEIIYGSTLLVTSGVTNGNTAWQCTFSGSLTVGTTAISFSSLNIGVPPYASLVGSYSLGGIPYSTATAFSVLAGTATANKILMSGATAAPSWSTTIYPSTVMQNDIIYGYENDVIGRLPTAARSSFATDQNGLPKWLQINDGQFIIGSTSGPPNAANITQGTNISVTNAANSITISTTGFASMTTVEVTGTSQAMLPNHIYIANNASQVSLSIPATFSVGDLFIITGKGAGGWITTQGSGQQIHLGSTASTTLGATGTLASTAQRDTVILMATTTNTTLTAISVQGNPDAL